MLTVYRLPFTEECGSKNRINWDFKMSKWAYSKQHVLSAGKYIVLESCPGWLETGYVSSGLVLIAGSVEQQRLGMVHIVQPDSGPYPNKSQQMPGYFADSGIEALLTEAGWNDPGNRPQDLGIILVGASSMLDSDDIFELGSKNLDQVRNILEEYGLSICKQDVGGHFIRKISVNLKDNQVWISLPGKKAYCL